MLILKKYLCKNKEGTVKMLVNLIDDLWHLYNLISTGDRLTCSTTRKVKMESASGNVDVSKVHIQLTISVVSMDYDFKDNYLHVKGTNIIENEYVKIGQFHTLDITNNSKITLYKENWDSIALATLDLLKDSIDKTDVAAILLQENRASLYMVHSNYTFLRDSITYKTKKKTYFSNTNLREDSLKHNFSEVIASILKHIAFDEIKCLVIASPGFLKDNLFQAINEESKNTKDKRLESLLKKIVLARVSNAYKHNIQEILSEPALKTQLSDTKIMKESQIIEEFLRILRVDSSRAFYGYAYVKMAMKAMAIESLLIIDSLMRNADLKMRRLYSKLIDSVKYNDGNVYIFSSNHPTGEQLKQMTGVAAILRYPMPELEEMDLELEDFNGP